MHTERQDAKEAASLNAMDSRRSSKAYLEAEDPSLQFGEEDIEREESKAKLVCFASESQPPALRVEEDPYLQLGDKDMERRGSKLARVVVEIASSQQEEDASVQRGEDDIEQGGSTPQVSCLAAVNDSLPAEEDPGLQQEGEDIERGESKSKLACLASEAPRLRAGGEISVRPGAKFIQGNRRITSYDMISDDESSCDEVKLPVLQAEIAPDIDRMVEAALRESATTVEADLLAPVNMGGFKMPKLENEDRFQNEHAQLIRVPTMIYLAVGIVVDIVFYFWDILILHWKATLFPRLGQGLWFALWIFIFWRGLDGKWCQPLSCFKTMVSYTSVCLIVREFTDGFVVALPALCITILTFNAICLLQFRYSVIVCVYAMVLVNVLIQTHPHNSGIYSTVLVTANANAFLLMSCLLGMLPTYVAELYLRHRFLRTGTLSFWMSAGDTHGSSRLSDTHGSSRLSVGQ